MRKSVRVCTIGGGSGMPIVNMALVRAGFSGIKSIVTTFDNGGDTGRTRTDERGEVLAFSDYWRSLISLWEDGTQKKIWEEMLRYRDGRDRNFGNAFFRFMSEKCGDLSKVDSLFAALVKADLKGEVIPVSLSPSNIAFETISGRKYTGEKYLDDLRMSVDRIKKVWLTPSIKANDEAVEALVNSDCIVVSTGSIYGSIISNFLPKGMVEAYRKSKAEKILITNLVSIAIETNKLDMFEYLKIFEQYLGKGRLFDQIIMPDFSKIKKETLDKIIYNYEVEHSYLFDNTNYDPKIGLVCDIVSIDRANMRLRHNEKKLSELFLKI